MKEARSEVEEPPRCGVADAGDAIMNSDVIREAFKKLFAFE